MLSAVVLAVLQPSDPGVSGSAWAVILTNGMCFATIAWIKETRPAGRHQLHVIARRDWTLVSAIVMSAGILSMIMASPTLILVSTLISPKVIDLDRSAQAEHPLDQGVVYRVQSSRPFKVQVTHLADFRLSHRLAVTDQKGRWESIHRGESYGVDHVPQFDEVVSEPGKYRASLAVLSEGRRICYDCTDKETNLIEFTRTGWPLHRQGVVIASVVRGAKPGDRMEFGRFYSIDVKETSCLISTATVEIMPAKTDDALSSAEEAANAMEMAADNAMTAANVVAEDQNIRVLPNVCSEGLEMSKGTGEVCLHEEPYDGFCERRSPSPADRHPTRIGTFRLSPVGSR
jgi:hypothetical protein